MFNHSRLILARKRRGLTGRKLATLINVSPVTITRLEKANNNPDPETLDALVRVLDFPKEFFFGDDIDELNKDASSFRSLTSMTSRERESALAAGAIAYMFSDWITARFNLPDADLIDFYDEQVPFIAAIQVRQYWGLGEKPIANMIHLLESKGVRVFFLSENTKKVDAFSCWRNSTPYMFLNTFKSSEHSRFDAAHELAHLVLHRHGGPHQGKQAEKDANSFASSFLMPDPDVVSQIPFFSSIEQIIRVKSRWGVSAAALAYRLHKMEIMSDWQYRTFWIQMGKRGYRDSEPNGMEKEESAIWKKVFRLLWKERITQDDIASDLHIPAGELAQLIFGADYSLDLPVHSHNKPNLKII